MSSLILRHDREGTATLTLNRPEKRNALNVELFLELESHLIQLAAETESIGVVVLRAEGAVFSAGADISQPTRAPRRHFQASVIEMLANLPQPVIGVVEGLCVTGGLELLLATDYILVSDDARFADTHARFALSAGWGMTQRLPRRVGPYKAREMMFTGRQYDGRQAAAMGLANLCTAPESLEAELAELLGAILRGSWFSHREHKRLLLSTDGAPLADGLAHEAYRGGQVGPDFAERAQALRKPSNPS